MLGMAWHWVTNWVIGWGGLGALLSLIAWALWFFCPTVPALDKILPYKAQLLHIAIGLTIFTVCSTHFFTSGYNKGYAVAINQVAAKNQEATDAIRKATSSIDDCNAAGRSWDTVAGLCQ
jgi:hypothetical protein